MKEVLEIYVSGFFPWLGITIGLLIITRFGFKWVAHGIAGTAAALRGTATKIGDTYTLNHTGGDTKS